MIAEAIRGFRTSVLLRRRARQAGVLYIATIATMVMGFLGSVVTTRLLGPVGYGDLKFVLNVFGFLAIISTLGVFSTGSQVLAKLGTGDEHRSSLTGALIMIGLRIAAGSMVFALLFGYLQPLIFGKDLRFLIMLSSPLLLVIFLQTCLENILQGENRMHQLSLLRFMPALLYVGLLVAVASLLQLTPIVVIGVQAVTTAAVGVGILFFLRPRFTQVKANVSLLWQANKGYGIHLYVGTLSGVATGSLSTFLISYYLDNTRVGFFSLAITLVAPLSLVAGVLGTTYFKDFAHTDILPRKVTLMAVGVAGTTLLLFLLLVHPLVQLVYTAPFARVATLASVVAVGATCEGFGDYMNRFLGAHGRGKELRNGAIAVGTVNVIGYVILIRFAGEMGAAVTRLTAGAVYASMMIWYYRRFRAAATKSNGT